MTTLDRLQRLLTSPWFNRTLDALAVALLIAVVVWDVIGPGTRGLATWTLLNGLAAFRLWRLAAVDSITEPFHGRLRASTHPVAQWFDTLVSCPWCLGFWIATGLTWGVWWLTGAYGVVDALIMMWAASAVTGLIASADERLHRW